MRARRALALALMGLGGVCVGLFLAEVLSRLLEPENHVQGDVRPIADAELGWLPRPGRLTLTTPEYSAVYEVNTLGLNDGPREPCAAESRMRLLALGDSHTFAAGVSWSEAWPHVLEERLFEGDARAGAVFNAAVSGYSLGQSLLRMRRLLPVLEPQWVLLGVSMATDLYDLIPPSRGGFVFLADRGRAYFDLDADGTLVERRELVGRAGLSAEVGQTAGSLRVRSWLDRLSLYRRLKSTTVAMRLSGLWPFDAPLWPGPDTAMRRRLDGGEAYRWALAGALLRRTAREASEAGARLLVVNIPYLPQVYDEVWQASFGRRPEEYDRWIAGERLAALCGDSGIAFVETTRRFVEEARRRGSWLHHRQDRHPTAAGHRLIAEEVAATLLRLGLPAAASRDAPALRRPAPGCPPARAR